MTKHYPTNTYMGASKRVLTLVSTDGETGNAFKDLLASSSEEQSEHKK